MRIMGSVVRAFSRLTFRTIAAILAASLAVFVGIEVSIPGGYRAVLLPNGDTQSARSRRIIDAFHLDEHVIVRWARWVADVAQGNFGNSARAGEDVTEVIMHRLPISLEIMLVAMAITLLLGIPLGLLAAAWSTRRAGRAVDIILSIAQSIPVYVLPLFLITFFSVRQGWLPAAGWVRLSTSITGNLKHLILPIAGLVVAEIGIVARLVRTEAARVLNQDFIAAALGKGLSPAYVMLRHALRPSSLGLLNVLGANIGALLSGALVIEIIFGIGALGRVMLESVLGRDLYMLLGLTTYLVIVYSAINAIVDVVVRLLDPRISRS